MYVGSKSGMGHRLRDEAVVEAPLRELQEGERIQQQKITNPQCNGTLGKETSPVL